MSRDLPALVIDRDGNVIEVFARNCCEARMLPIVVELVSEGIGLSWVKCKVL